MNDSELISTKPGDKFGFANTVPQSVSDRLDQQIADMVTQRVV